MTSAARWDDPGKEILLKTVVGLRSWGRSFHYCRWGEALVAPRVVLHLFRIKTRQDKTRESNHDNFLFQFHSVFLPRYPRGSQYAIISLWIYNNPNYLIIINNLWQCVWTWFEVMSLLNLFGVGLRSLISF